MKLSQERIAVDEVVTAAATVEVIAAAAVVIAAEIATNASRGGKAFKVKRGMGRARGCQQYSFPSPFPLLFPCRGRELQLQALATAHDFHFILLTGFHLS